jgi:hypothetical protein
MLIEKRMPRSCFASPGGATGYREAPGSGELDHGQAGGVQVDDRRPAGSGDLQPEVERGDAGVERCPQGRADLPGAGSTKTALPSRDPGTRDIAVCRVQTRNETWVVLHGAPLTSTGTPRIAVIVEPAHPDRIYPLLASAYGFTEREKDITGLVLQGASTTQIASELVVSAHTGWPARRT